ncbi:MAG: DNA-deoxyinosine glycosylase [Clostridia bacterium]|nr:DNA-deoxyinosine glycosylase [Clostridia bacterium]
MRLEHEFSPIYNENSKVLILGSFPSVKSREQCFYYGHPQNRFWRLLAMICRSDVPTTVKDKKALCLSNGIALWDVIQSCEIKGSSDSSIKNVKVNDLSVILDNCNIQKIFVNGGTAYDLFVKYQQTTINKHAVKLPSTSPANAAWSLERLYSAWCIIEEYL